MFKILGKIILCLLIIATYIALKTPTVIAFAETIVQNIISLF